MSRRLSCLWRVCVKPQCAQRAAFWLALPPCARELRSEKLKNASNSRWLSYGNLVRHAGVAGLKPSAPACEHHSPHAAANEEAAEQEEGPAPSKPTNDCQCRHRGGAPGGRPVWAPGGRPVWAPGAGRWELSSSHALVLAHASTQTPPGGRDNKRRRCRARAAAMLRRRLRTRRRSGECPCRRRAGTRGSWRWSGVPASHFKS